MLWGRISLLPLPRQTASHYTAIAAYTKLDKLMKKKLVPLKCPINVNRRKTLVSSLSDSNPTPQTFIYPDGAAHVAFLTTAYYLADICSSVGWIPVFNLGSFTKVTESLPKNASLLSDFRALQPSITGSSVYAASIDWACQAVLSRQPGPLHWLLLPGTSPLL